MIAILAYGYFCGWIYRRFLTWKASSGVLGMGISTAALLPAMALESSITKIIGGVAVVALVAWIVVHHRHSAVLSLAKSQVTRPLRILHVIPSVAISDGGPSRALELMERSLSEAGVSVTTLTTDHDLIISGNSSHASFAEPRKCIHTHSCPCVVQLV